MIKIAIIDKNPTARELIKNFLISDNEIEIVCDCEDFSDINLENCDLVIFDINSSNKEVVFEFIQKAKKREIKLIATSYEMSSSIVTQTLSAGCDDFLIKPVLKNILENSVKKIFLTKKEKNIALSSAIAFFSSKGGTGKTSSVINIGYNLGKITNKKICILDLSFSEENAACYLNLKNIDYNFLFSVLKENKKETLYSLLPQFENSNLYVISLLSELNLSARLNQTQIANLINSLKNVFDYVLIDTTSTINDSIIPILNCSNMVIYSAILSTPSIQSAQKHFEMFLKTGYNKNRIKLLINRYSDNSVKELGTLEEKIQKTADYKIPNNYLTIMDAINQMKPLEITNPNSNIAKAYMETSREIIKLEINQNIDNNCTIFNILKRMGE